MAISRQISAAYKGAGAALALSLSLTFAATSAQAWTYKTLYDFTPGSNGFVPQGIMRDEATGDIYGLTDRGGDLTGCYGQGCGVVFKLAADGTETVLHFFTGIDGSSPRGTPIRDRKGNLYGATEFGGDLSCGDYNLGCGVVFKLTPKGRLTVLHTFKGQDGDGPFAGLMQDAGTGDFYGTTEAGGANGKGTVFKLAANGTYKVLHSFSGGSDGAFPGGRLIEDAEGNLYGTASEGGEEDCGTIFRIAPAGREKVLYAFTRNSTGHPMAGLRRDKLGNLYGAGAGGRGYHGSLFRLTSDGKFKVLHAFTTKRGISSPVYELLRTHAGTIYGTLTEGGGGGGVFKLGADGSYEVLFVFNYNSGYYPGSGVIGDKAGNLYGTTVLGGTKNGGTVFELVK